MEGNGTRTDYDALRRAELDIIEGPLPSIDPEDEFRLVATDAQLSDALARIACYGPPCTPQAPCTNCQLRRRYIALQLHRAKHGRCIHPASESDDSRPGTNGHAKTPATPATPRREDDWPAPPDPAAYDGLAGEVVRLIEPETEADPVALLIHFLAAFGSAAGRIPYYSVGARRHYPNLFGVLVGRTGKSRKGTALSWVETLFKVADKEWADKRIETGLSSGEGLVAAVRDKITRWQDIKDRGRVTGREEVTVDEGVTDKRLLVVEEEFSSVLRVAARDGNTLSAVIRQAWDGGRLGNLRRNSPDKATDAHVSIIGHITREELRKDLAETDLANGFANRFLWVCGKRSKLLPDGGKLLDLTQLGNEVGEALTFARKVGRLTRDGEAAEIWQEEYGRLSEETPGIVGLVTNRAEAQTLRLSVVYALLDFSGSVKGRHLRSAMALWDYCRRSCQYIFGESTGEEEADRILEALKAADARGLTRTEINRIFAGHRPADLLERSLGRLLELGLAVVTDESGDSGGRPVKRWRYSKSAK